MRVDLITLEETILNGNKSIMQAHKNIIADIKAAKEITVAEMKVNANGSKFTSLNVLDAASIAQVIALIESRILVKTEKISSREFPSNNSQESRRFHPYQNNSGNHYSLEIFLGKLIMDKIIIK